MSKQQAICAAMVDRIAGRYLDVLAEAEDIKKQLLRYCRLTGFTPKDAPKTKMLAGELYEVLASRATRTVVDQNAARRLKDRMRLEPRAFRKLFATRTVFDLQDDAERCVMQMHASFQRAFHRAVLHENSKKPRLTVRKRKQAAGKKAA